MTLDRTESLEYWAKHSPFIKLGDGDKMVGVFKGKTHPRTIVWFDGKYHPYDPLVHASKKGQDGKPLKPWAKEAGNFVFQDEDGRWVAKIFDASKAFFNAWVKRVTKFGDDKLYEVERDGEGTKTKWVIDPAGDITPEIREAIEAVDLHEIANFFKDSNDTTNGDKDNADFPFGANEGE